jgi:AcrR family transcriptional regulator
MKEEILQAALEQFLKHGIRKMSIPKLIAVLGISSKTVYKYYKNKEELLEAVLNLHYDNLYQQLKDLSSEQKAVPLLLDIWYLSIEREYNVNNVFYKDLNYYYPELEEKFNKRLSGDLWKQILQVVHRGIEEGVFKENIDPEVAMEGISVLYNAVARTEQFEKFSKPPYEIFLNTLALYIRGFCTSKGITELDEYIKTLKPFGGGKKTRKS